MTVNIDGTEITGATIDGDTVTEITVDGDVVWSTSDVTVLDDYETGSVDNYAGDAGSFSVVQDSTLEGSYLLTATATNDRMVKDAQTTTRGNDYRVHYRAAGGDDRVWFIIGDQYPSSGSMNQDHYHARIETGNDRLLVGRRTGGSYDGWSDTTVSLSPDTEYRIGIRWGATGTADNVEAYILDSSGTELGSVAITDDGWTGGTFGFYTSNSTNTQLDYVTERPL